MKSFVLHLQDATHYERIDQVASFVGQDDSGLFGILADHARMMTVLAFGLARYRTTDDRWHFLAVPRGLLYCVDNNLYLSARRYIRDDDYAQISQALEEQLVTEETALHSIKDSLRRLEEEMFKRLWRMGRGEYAAS
ncbi:MAG: F0F1 ATP synthase subunit epsilon [Nitrospirota bacterium]